MSNCDEYYQHERTEVLPFLPETYSKVLEIGCGTGNFRKLLSTHEEYWGVEPSINAVEIAIKVLDKVLHGTFDEVELEIPDGYFDMVICCDVIEHMPSHDNFLKAIGRKLKKGGVLVASIPNVRYQRNLYNLLIKKDWRYEEEGILDDTHLRFFTKKSVRRSMEKNAFVIQKIGYINPMKGSTAKVAFSFLASLVLGLDSRFYQIGVRVAV